MKVLIAIAKRRCNLLSYEYYSMLGVRYINSSMGPLCILYRVPVYFYK